jgi:hypothetical protein
VRCDSSRPNRETRSRAKECAAGALPPKSLVAGGALRSSPVQKNPPRSLQSNVQRLFTESVVVLDEPQVEAVISRAQAVWENSGTVRPSSFHCAASTASKSRSKPTQCSEFRKIRPLRGTPDSLESSVRASQRRTSDSCHSVQLVLWRRADASCVGAGARRPLVLDSWRRFCGPPRRGRVRLSGLRMRPLRFLRMLLPVLVLAASGCAGSVKQSSDDDDAGETGSGGTSSGGSSSGGTAGGKAVGGWRRRRVSRG